MSKEWRMKKLGKIQIVLIVLVAAVTLAAWTEYLRPGSIRSLASSLKSYFFKENINMSEPPSPKPRRVRAPEFSGVVEWLNVGQPLSLRALRGRVVLLDFWTYCCINCMHVLPDLKYLEKKYTGEPFVVIGVHSAKFINERDPQNIRMAILRYGIQHPVAVDSRMEVWEAYGVHAWPTQMLIDSEGYVVGAISGEGHRETLDRAVGELLAEGRKKGTLASTPLQFVLETETRKSSLHFPGKVFVDEKSRRLFIADSNNNQIVVATLDGKILERIGHGEEGLLDGDLKQVQFNHPQGMALDGEMLYVADTENHAIRAVDLKKKTVATVAGNGSQSLGLKMEGPARQTALSSPWDLVLHGQKLYIAMAGTHQIAVLDLRKNEISVFAGSGREGRVDGPRLSAALAQPSGITTDGRKLYFADSEVSSIRSVDLGPDGKVTTLVGLDLFVFGDKDGIGNTVRLQHPLGISYSNGRCYIADTYNHKIKVLLPGSREMTTLAGTGKPGFKDDTQEKAEFYEPGGLYATAEKIYVADTNNHAIRIIDLKSRQVSTLFLP